jgi:hypothetical protein
VSHTLLPNVNEKFFLSGVRSKFHFKFNVSFHFSVLYVLVKLVFGYSENSLCTCSAFVISYSRGVKLWPTAHHVTPLTYQKVTYNYSHF